MQIQATSLLFGGRMMVLRSGIGSKSPVKAYRSALGLTAGVVALAVAAFGAEVKAGEYELYKSGAFEATGQLGLGFGLFAVPNAQFGGGSADGRTGATAKIENSPTYFDAYAKPQLNLRYDLGGSKLYATTSGVVVGTLGDGDANATTTTPGQPWDVDLEEAYVGYSFAAPFGKEGGTIAIQGGRQSFVLDDGFVIGDGTYDQGSRGAYYMAPRTAFNGYGVVKFNTNPVRGDIFLLRSNFLSLRDSGNNVGDGQETTFAGFSVTLFEDAEREGADGSSVYLDRKRYVTASYFKILDSSTPQVNGGASSSTNLAGDTRKNLNVLSFAAGGQVLPSWSAFSIYGNYVSQWRDRDAAASLYEVRADALYIEPGYTFEEAPWTPMVYYRYSYFSGDNNTADTKTESYDPLFYMNSPRRFFATGFSGEIGGQYNFFNQNLNIQQFGVRGTPSFHIANDEDSLTLGLNFFRYSREKPAAGNSDHLADELNLTAEYTLNANIFTTAAAGVAWAGRGQEQEQVAATPTRRADTENYVFEWIVYYTF